MKDRLYKVRGHITLKLLLTKCAWQEMVMFVLF